METMSTTSENGTKDPCLTPNTLSRWTCLQARRMLVSLVRLSCTLPPSLPDVPEGTKIPVIMTIHPYYDFGGEGMPGLGDVQIQTQFLMAGLEMGV